MENGNPETCQSRKLIIFQVSCGLCKQRWCLTHLPSFRLMYGVFDNQSQFKTWTISLCCAEKAKLFFLRKSPTEMVKITKM